MWQGRVVRGVVQGCVEEFWHTHGMACAMHVHVYMHMHDMCMAYAYLGDVVVGVLVDHALDDLARVHAGLAVDDVGAVVLLLDHLGLCGVVLLPLQLLLRLLLALHVLDVPGVNRDTRGRRRCRCRCRGRGRGRGRGGWVRLRSGEGWVGIRLRSGVG